MVAQEGLSPDGLSKEILALTSSPSTPPPPHLLSVQAEEVNVTKGLEQVSMVVCV